KEDLLVQVGAGVPRDADVLEIVGGAACFFQAVPNRFRWESGPVLDAPEPLFFGGGHDLAVPQETGGGTGVIGVDAEDVHSDIPSMRPTSVRRPAGSSLGAPSTE